MPTLVTFLVFFQALGACIGTFSALQGELAYIRAMRDGKIDVAERRHLDALARALRFGMTLLLVASLGLVVAMYAAHASLQPALTPSYWTLIALALLVITISWALSRRHVSFAMGSALAFTGWWFLAYLTLGWLPPVSFGAAVALFVIAAAIFYAVLSLARFYARPSGH